MQSFSTLKRAVAIVMIVLKVTILKITINQADFSEAAGLERGPLSLVRTTEELLGRNSSGCGLENRD
jgi:hypothetical protein